MGQARCIRLLLLFCPEGLCMSERVAVPLALIGRDLGRGMDRPILNPREAPWQLHPLPRAISTSLDP